MELDRIDRKIVVALMADATLPVARLADRVGLSQTPCWKRVQKLQAAGVIRGRVAVVDPEAVGLRLTVFAEVALAEQDPTHHQRFTAAVSAMPEVMEVHQLTGDPDYVLRIVVRDVEAFEGVREAILAAVPLRSLAAQFALKRVKSETVLPIDTVSP